MSSTIGNTPKINWVAFQLANDFGIERNNDEIWWAIYNDSGRNSEIAHQMLAEISNNKNSMSEFAKSLSTGRKVVYVDSKLNINQMLIAGFAFFLIGVLIGGVL